MYMVDGDSFSVARSELPDSLVSDNRPDSLAANGYSFSMPEFCRFSCGVPRLPGKEKNYLFNTECYIFCSEHAANAVANAGPKMTTPSRLNHAAGLTGRVTM
jgi:hypothetical protein